MKYKILIFAMLIMVSGIRVPAQSTNDGDASITVPKRYVSSEGLNHQIQPPSEAPAKVSEWVGIGKEIGEATKEGLNSVVDASEKFGTTRVGIFVMVMIAWRIIGHQLMGIVFGVPILVGGLFLWWQVMRRLFLGYQVLDKKEGKVKTYKRQEPMEFISGDGRIAAGIASVFSLFLFVTVMLCIIF